MKRLYIFIALPLFASTVAAHCQNPAPGDSVTVRKYLAISDAHYAEDRMDSAAWYCLKAGELAKALDDKKAYADFVSYYIPILNRQGKYQEAHDLAAESVAICKTLGDKSLLALAYNNLGNQDQYLGDLNSSATNYLNALVFSEGVDKPERRLRYSNNLASIFLALEEKEKSYYYASKSYDLAVETQDSVGMASSLVNLALSEVMNEKNEDALRHLDQVFELGKALGDDSYVLDALINKADINAQMKNYSEALRLYERSSVLLRNYPVPDYEMYVYWGLAQNHFFLSHYPRANEFLMKAIKVAKDLQALQELSKLYLLGSEINEKMNKHALALDLRKQYGVLNDSLVGLDTRESIHKLEIEYQTAQKEKAIADQQLIITRNNLEIEKKDKSILWWATISISLLSAILFFIMVYRNKQRRNAEKIQLLQKQNEVQVLNALMEGEEKERSRLARELHDGVGGILSASKMHLSVVQEEETSSQHTHLLRTISTMLDQASHEIRTIAHNLFPDVVLMQNFDEAIRSHCARISNPGLDVEYICLGQPPQLQNRFKLLIYRAVQETLNNVIKHAKANHVLVQISHYDGTLTIVVEDNGVGFDKDTVKGMGLIGLEDKIAKIGGRLSIETQAGKGTTVHMEFDISALKENMVEETSSVPV